MTLLHSPQAKVFCSIEQADPQYISIYVRSNGIKAKDGYGEPKALQSRLAGAADYLYAECQPSAYDVYLTEMGRYAEAVHFSESRYGRATHAGDKGHFYSRGLPQWTA